MDLLLVVGVAREGVDRQLELDLRARVLLDEGGGGRGALGRLDCSYDLGGAVHLFCFCVTCGGGRLVRRAVRRARGQSEGNLSAILSGAAPRRLPLAA